MPEFERPARRALHVAIVAGQLVVVALGLLVIGLYVCPPGRAVPLWIVVVGATAIAGVGATAKVSDATRRAWGEWWATGLAAATAIWVALELLLAPMLRDLFLAGLLVLALLVAVFAALLVAALRAWRHRLDTLIAIAIVTASLFLVFGDTGPRVVSAGIRWRLQLVESRYLDQVADGRMVDDYPDEQVGPGPSYAWLWSLRMLGNGDGIVLDRFPQSRRTHHIPRFTVIGLYRVVRCEHLWDDWYWCNFT